MSGPALNRPSQALPFVFPPYQERLQTYSDFRPTSLYSPVESFGTDFNTDSPPSPDTPMSTTFASAYTLPQDGDWPTWDANVEFSPKPSFLKPETFDESPALDSIPPRGRPLSPVVDLMDLTNSAVDDAVVFGREGMNDTQPLFQPLPPRPQPTKPAGTTSKPALFVKTTSTSPTCRVHGPPPTQDERTAKRYPSRNRKRKSSASTTPSASSSSPTSSDDDLSPPPRTRRTSGIPSAAAAAPKKTAHNMIEKRYRNNLNDKIAALRDAVPALRETANRAEGQTSCSEDEDEGGGPVIRGRGREGRSASRRGVRVGGSSKGSDQIGRIPPAHRLNKATILSKATEYIVHLEKLNQSMAEENDALRASIGGLEMLVMGRGGSGMWN